MARNYYISRSGRLARQDNTLYLQSETEDGNSTKTPIPIEDVNALYLYGEIDLNTRLLNFLAQKSTPAHVFNYYGYYAGSYYPREYLNSGFLLVQQVQHYQSKTKRIVIARELIKAAVHGIQRNLTYYQNRGKDVGKQIEEIRPRKRSCKTVSGGVTPLDRRSRALWHLFWLYRP